MSTVKVGGRPYVEVSGGAKIEDVNSLNGALMTYDTSVPPGGDLSTAAGSGGRTWGGPKADSKTAITATGTVKSGAGYYYGWIVTTALSAAAVTIYDNTVASGTVIDVIAASTAAGTRGVLPTPIPCSTGIHAVVGGTGTILFLYT